MTVAKINLKSLPEPNRRHPERSEGSHPVKGDPSPTAQDDKLSPQTLLDSLKEKQRLFQTLKSEGLIHQDKHLAMERQLRETIEELEVLIPQLEVCDG